jgi:hypothetical protein
MDEEARAIRTDITQTRAELGDAVEELSQRLTPRRQAQRIVSERRHAVQERIGSVSPQDIGPMADRARAAIVAQPQAAAALGALALVLLRQRSRRR